MFRALLLLLTLAVAAQAEEQVYTGQFRYLADAGLFEDCRSGDRWPVAQEAANAELEAAYLARVQGGESLWVKVEGRLKRKLDLVKGSRETLLVVTRLLESDVRGCDALPEVALEGTQWRLAELGGRKVPQGRRRDPYLVLQPAAGKALGFGGCNHFKAGYRLDGEKIRFEQPGSTRMRCETGYELETAYLRMLLSAHNWRTRGQLLDLFDASGRRIARFTASDSR